VLTQLLLLLLLLLAVVHYDTSLYYCNTVSSSLRLHLLTVTLLTVGYDCTDLRQGVHASYRDPALSGLAVQQR
jgi:hypothetical protein